MTTRPPKSVLKHRPQAQDKGKVHHGERSSGGSKPPSPKDHEMSKGLDLYSSIVRYMRICPTTPHIYLRSERTEQGYHFKQAPKVIFWFSYVHSLLMQRSELLLLRKLYLQRFYTSQFLFKLKKFYHLQHFVLTEGCVYQSFNLSSEECKLPKLNVLCKQTMSLLNDFQSCSVAHITQAFNIDTQLFSRMVTKLHGILARIEFDTVQCVLALRDIILKEIRFCYLFSNFKSRMYTLVKQVSAFNMCVFHPALRDLDHVCISVEEIVSHNIATASLNIARSMYHKILTAHTKSVANVSVHTKDFTTVLTECQKCQVCLKYGVYLHKYCNTKCGQFVDAISMMLQSADDTKLYCKTDNSNSHHVEEELSRGLQKAMMGLSLSAVAYEDSVRAGVRTAVVVHELYCDPSSTKRKKKDKKGEKKEEPKEPPNKDDMNWDDNYTDTAYVFTSKGLPNSWNSLDSLEGNEFIITKLLPSKYSVCYSTNMHNFGLSTLRWNIQEMHVKGFEEVVRLASVGGDSRKVMESAVNHISLLNNIITLQLQEIKLQQVQLFLDHTAHLHTFTSYLLSKYDVWCRGYLIAWDMLNLFRYMSDLDSLKTCLSATIFLPLTCEQKEGLPLYLCKGFENKLKLLNSTHEDLTVQMGQMEKLLKDGMMQCIVNKFELPPSSYWKKDIVDWGTPAPCVQQIIELVLQPLLTALEEMPSSLQSKVYHYMFGSITQLVRHVMRCDKKIAVSLCGVLHMQKALKDLCDCVSVSSIAKQQLATSSDISLLKDELELLLGRRAKVSTKQNLYKCGCDIDKDNWKRLSAPQLCTDCNKGETTGNSPRDIFSDSEVDGSPAMLGRSPSDYLPHKKQMSWKKLTKLKSEVKLKK